MKYFPKKYIFLFASFFLIVVLCFSLSDRVWFGAREKNKIDFYPSENIPEGTEDLNGLLFEYKNRYNLPAISAAVIVEDSLKAIGAFGERKWKSNITVNLNDKFRIGSVVKPMTATVAAMLVEQGKISWDTRIIDVFEQDSFPINEAIKHVTLEQLLSHTSGIVRGLGTERKQSYWKPIVKKYNDPTTQRTVYIQTALNESPQFEPGSKYLYSNDAYNVAGVMMERKTGKQWETLLIELLFEPLKMNSVGFGVPDISGKIEQPWEHYQRPILGKKAFQPAFKDYIAPSFLSCSGGLHMNIEDLAKFANFHLQGAKGISTLLKPESFKKLHTSILSNSALGWQVDGHHIFHWGSNSRNQTNIWFSKEWDMATVITTNQSEEDGNITIPAISDLWNVMVAKYKID